MTDENTAARRSQRRAARQFGLIVSAVAAIVAVLLWRRDVLWEAEAAAGAATLILGVTVIVPQALTPLRRVWMQLAAVLGWINLHLLLGVAFYSLFTIVGGIMRWRGRDPLQRKLDPGCASYWQARECTRTPREQFERQF